MNKKYIFYIVVAIVAMIIIYYVFFAGKPTEPLEAAAGNIADPNNPYNFLIPNEIEPTAWDGKAKTKISQADFNIKSKQAAADAKAGKAGFSWIVPKAEESQGQYWLQQYGMDTDKAIAYTAREFISTQYYY
jgi:hypothetical protein